MSQQFLLMKKFQTNGKSTKRINKRSDVSDAPGLFAILNFLLNFGFRKLFNACNRTLDHYHSQISFH